jgi:tRNA(Ile2) C34 agmatinyltransferase TiaS
MSKKKPQDESKSLAPHGMTPEEALQRMFATPLPSKPMYCPKCREQITGLTLVGDEGELRCPKCGTIATDEHPKS